MAFQSVPNTAMFTAKFSGPDGTKPSFSLYSRNTLAPWGPSQLAAIEADFRNAILDHYLPILPDDHTFVGITSRDLEAEFGLVIEHAPVNDPGGLASPSLPAEVAVRGSFIGEPGSAPARGGIYMLPPGESQVVGSILTGGAVDALQNALEEMHEAMNAGGPAHVIVSRYSGTALVPGPGGQTLRRPVKRAEGVTNTVPTVIVRPRVDSQRKRRPTE